MTNVVLEILNVFFFGMSPDVSTFKVLVFKSDFKFWIGASEY